MACILVVEDERNIRFLVTSILRARGYAVAEATDGAEALARLLGLPAIDAVLTDVRMPGMSGIELTETLRAQAYALPIIVMSAYVDDGQTVLEAGADYFLPKPFTHRKLIETVQQFVMNA